MASQRQFNQCKFCNVEINIDSKFCSKECYRLWRKKPGFQVPNAKKFKKGLITWNKGIKYTDEMKSKMNMSGLLKNFKGNKLSQEIKNKISKSHFGIKHTEETKKKIIHSLNKRFLSGEPTSLEKILYDELDKNELFYIKQKEFGGKFLVDSFLPKFNLIIEADGEYWHSLPKNIERDKSKDAYLKKCGYLILRLPEKELINGSFKNKIRKYYVK